MCIYILLDCYEGICYNKNIGVAKLYFKNKAFCKYLKFNLGGKNKMKRKIITTITTMLCMFMLFTVVSYARSNTIYKEYNIYTLTCHIDCEKTYGKGWTSGSANPYKNYVSVMIYDINQDVIGSSYKTQNSKVTLTLTHAGVYGTRTTHAAVDAKGYYLEPLSQSIVQFQGW